MMKRRRKRRRKAKTMDEERRRRGTRDEEEDEDEEGEGEDEEDEEEEEEEGGAGRVPSREDRERRSHGQAPTSPTTTPQMRCTSSLARPSGTTRSIVASAVFSILIL
eukprot:scaffold5749_cov104-Isochrysis_galbana.AAC.3